MKNFIKSFVFVLLVLIPGASFAGLPVYNADAYVKQSNCENCMTPAEVSCATSVASVDSWRVQCPDQRPFRIVFDGELPPVLMQKFMEAMKKSGYMTREDFEKALTDKKVVTESNFDKLLRKNGVLTKKEAEKIYVTTEKFEGLVKSLQEEKNGVVAGTQPSQLPPSTVTPQPQPAPAPQPKQPPVVTPAPQPQPTPLPQPQPQPQPAPAPTTFSDWFGTDREFGVTLKVGDTAINELAVRTRPANVKFTDNWKLWPEFGIGTAYIPAKTMESLGQWGWVSLSAGLVLTYKHDDMWRWEIGGMFHRAGSPRIKRWAAEEHGLRGGLTLNNKVYLGVEYGWSEKGWLAHSKEKTDMSVVGGFVW